MITGHAGIILGTSNMDEAKRFISDFGLQEKHADKNSVTYLLEEGSTVTLKSSDDPSLPPPLGTDVGVREICWGVDTQDALDELEANLSRDLEVSKDSDGSISFIDPSGIATQIKVFQRTPVLYCPEPLNAPDAIRRLGTRRRWRRRAHPKVIQHVVYVVDDALEAARFYMHRLNFRLTDINRNVGYFLRAEGISEHHSIFFLNKGSVPGSETPRPDHVSFGVEDIDEMMAGAMHMQRSGWKKTMGPGRHRIGSALFYYLKTPFGIEFEYDTDNDHLDDHWIPHEWETRFGMINWVAGDLPPFWREEPEWEYKAVPADHPIYEPYPVKLREANSESAGTGKSKT
ncbi:MAG: glyoxalase [Robiginitomaculum sp.]|nr:MAG: glyoxalase [Robiginitomaculum sp.]